MLGAGLIKIRGDKRWLDLTCMNYHYEIKPNPNPLSYFLHQSPEIIHEIETACNLFVELIVPFMILLPYPRIMRLFVGHVNILFQEIIIFQETIFLKIG